MGSPRGGLLYRSRVSGSNGQALVPVLVGTPAGIAWEGRGLAQKQRAILKVLRLEAVSSLLTLYLKDVFFLEGRPSAPSMAATGVFCVPGSGRSTYLDDALSDPT